MQPDEAHKWISENVSVTRQKVLLMKRLIVEHGSFDVALNKMVPDRAAQVVLHPNVDSMPALRQVTNWISFGLAGCEALWALVHSGVFIQTSESVRAFSVRIPWTTVHGNSGGISAGWDFPKFSSAYPAATRRSLVSDRNEILSDPDLYLDRLSLPEIHPEIAEAVRDSVRCFRQELFMPSVVMLAKASEGAWIELGSALAIALASDTKAQKLATDVTSWSVSFATKLRDIVNFYESRQDALRPINEQAGVRIEDVRIARHWSETLRDARNAVHHGVSAHTSHTYETVATLLLSATPHFQTLYHLHRAAMGEVAKTTTSSK